MLFELDDTNLYDLKNNYFNINEINYDNNKLDIKNGFYLGNIFTSSYKPYKNYEPKRINAYSEQEKMLLRIYELDFIVNDLGLYLDLNPNDTNTFLLFKKSANELNLLKNKYNKTYQVLDLCNDTNNNYTWFNNPWPWDGGQNV